MVPLIAVLVVAAIATVVTIVIGGPARTSVPDRSASGARPTVAAGERALTAAGYRCQDSLAEPPVRRCLRADGPTASMVAVGLQRGPRDAIARVHIESYSDEFAHLAGGGDFDEGDQERHKARTRLVRHAYRAVVPALYGQRSAGWANKIGGKKGSVRGSGLTAVFADDGHTTQVILLPDSAGQPPIPTERKLKLDPAEFKRRLTDAGFNCDNPYRECRMPHSDTMPGEIAVSESGVAAEVLFTVRMNYSLTEVDPKDDIGPEVVADAFTRVLELAGYDDATVAELVTTAVASGSAATIDTDNANVFVNATVTNDKASYAALRVMGVRW